MRAASDTELVLAAGTGNKQAFGALADRHTNRARQVAIRLVGNAEVAGELVQEALLQAYLGLSTLREPAYFGAWQIGIIQNLCRTYLRAQQRLPLTPDWPAEADLLTDDALDPVAQLEAQERRDLVNAAQIDTEHLLLGILREGGGMAVKLLQDLGVDLAALEQQVLTTVSGKTQ